MSRTACPPHLLTRTSWSHFTRACWQSEDVANLAKGHRCRLRSGMHVHACMSVCRCVHIVLCTACVLHLQPAWQEADSAAWWFTAPVAYSTSAGPPRHHGIGWVNGWIIYNDLSCCPQGAVSGSGGPRSPSPRWEMGAKAGACKMGAKEGAAACPREGRTRVGWEVVALAA